MIKPYVEKFPTKTEFCRAVGILPQSLTQIEQGKRPIPPKVCNALEKLFGADKKKLRPDIFGEPEPHTHPKEPAQDPDASLPARTDNSERTSPPGQEIYTT